MDKTMNQESGNVVLGLAKLHKLTVYIYTDTYV